MMWSSLWPWRWLRAKCAPARRQASSARLAVELLEDRQLPSTTTSALAYQTWRTQTFKVDDIQVANLSNPSAMAPTVTAVPANGSFGSMIGLPSVFGNSTYRGEGYSVAVIDTGIDYRHASLGGGFGAGYKVVGGWDFVNNDANPLDDNGHGTHVAGIIGSTSSTYSGVAPNVNLIALKVLDKNGSGSFGNVESALKWIVTNQSKYNIVAINLSLGTGNYTSNPYTFLEDEFSALRSKGVFLSIAAGNSFYTNNSTPGVDYPAISPQVVSVGAVYSGNFGQVAWGSGARDNTTAVDRIASFSQRGSMLSLMAPGAMITSTYLNNTNQTMAGTSMAAPVVAGAAVILHQAMDARGLTANQTTILTAMQSTGVRVVDGDDENDNVTNTGLAFKRLDLGAALNSLGTPANSAPVLHTIANQTMAQGSTRTITLSAADPNGDPVTFTVSIAGATGGQAYQLKNQLSLTYAGSYYTNSWGQNEKWISSASNTWYCLMPNGQLRRFTGSMTTTLQATNLIATLDAGVYNDPSLLWNAAAPASPTVSVTGNQLTIVTPANATPGSYPITVTASDGALSSTKTFTLTVNGPNTAPQFGTLASQSLFTNRSQTITLAATDAQGDAITYSARMLGTFTKAPAVLVLNGNQLTIHTSPDHVGGYDIQVTASDGSLSSNVTLHVDVAASPIAKRLTSDFNGDRIQDTAFFNQDGTWWISLNRADGTYVNQRWAAWQPASTWASIHLADVNADGKTDVIGFNNDGSWHVGLATSANSFASTRWAQWGAASNWRTIQVGDFNGDRKTDIMGFANNGAVWIGLSTGTTFSATAWLNWGPAANWLYVSVADFNADGKLDLVGLSTVGNLYVATSTGTTFTSALWAKWNTTPAWTTFGVADIDHDDVVDFAARNSNGVWQVGYSTRSSFRTVVWTGANAPI